jgi:hypothetical protein
MRGTKWLSQAVDKNDIESGVLNIIQAPVGSGKSFYALNGLNELASKNSKYLYVIDTVNGREQLLKESNTAAYSKAWEDNIAYEFLDGMESIDENKIVVLSYAKLGVLTKRIPHFFKKFEIVVCDELHSGIEMSEYSKGYKQYYNYAELAIQELKAAVKYTDIKVIALTATPNRVIEYFNGMVKYIPIDDDIRRFEEHDTIPYTNPNTILEMLINGDRGIIYTPFINDMKRIQELLTQKGFKAISIWSIHSKKTMTDEQRQAREYIIKNETFPPDIDILIINKSFETGINIRGDIDFIMIHSMTQDIQTQVRGRYRNDLPILFVYSNHLKSELQLLPKYIGRRLFKEDKSELCGELNVRNNQGKVMGWTTIKKMLENQGYRITDGRQSDKRYSIIWFTEKVDSDFN